MHPSNEDEFERIRIAYHDELRRFIASRVDKREVEDVLQDIWSAFAQASAGVQIDQPRAWLYRSAKNLLVDRSRRLTRQPRLVSIDEAIDLGLEDLEDFDTEAFWDRFDAAIDKLPDAQAEVFVRNELEGETLREIAESLDEKLKTIISRKQYAKQRLRMELRGWYDAFFNN